jgi:hypothetical protein
MPFLCALLLWLWEVWFLDLAISFNLPQDLGFTLVTGCYFQLISVAAATQSTTPLLLPPPRNACRRPHLSAADNQRLLPLLEVMMMRAPREPAVQAAVKF